MTKKDSLYREDMFNAPRMKAARVAIGMSQELLAEELNMSLSGVRKVERGGVSLPRNIAAIASVLKVSPEWLLSKGGIDIPERDSLNELSPIETISCSVVGIVEAGVWREALEYLAEDQKVYQVRYFPNFEGFEQRMFEVVGPSMNMHYPEGQLLHCVRLAFGPRNIEILNGDHVIVQRQRGQLYEATVKEFQDGQLWPRSTDPRHQAPIEVSESESESVEITYLVLGAYRHNKGLDSR